MARMTDGTLAMDFKLRLPSALRNAPKKPTMGTPRVIILSLSGIRCADVVRLVRDVPRPGGEVAKVSAQSSLLQLTLALR